MNYQLLIDDLNSIVSAVKTLQANEGREMENITVTQDAIRVLREKFPAAYTGSNDLVKHVFKNMGLPEVPGRNIKQRPDVVHPIVARELDVSKLTKIGVGYGVKTHGTRGTATHSSLGFRRPNENIDLLTVLENNPRGLTGSARVDSSNVDQIVITFEEIQDGRYSFIASKEQMVFAMPFDRNMAFILYALDSKIVAIPVNGYTERKTTTVSIVRLVEQFDKKKVEGINATFSIDGEVLYYITSSNERAKVLQNPVLARLRLMDHQDLLRTLIQRPDLFITADEVMKIVMAIHFSSLGQ